MIYQRKAQGTEPFAALFALDQSQLFQAQYDFRIAVAKRSTTVQTLQNITLGSAQFFPPNHVATLTPKIFLKASKPVQLKN